MDVCYCFCRCCCLIWARFCDSAVPLAGCGVTCCDTTRLIGRSRGSKQQKRTDFCPFARQQVCRRNGNIEAFVLVAVMIGSKERMMPGCVEIAGVLLHLHEPLVSQCKSDSAELTTEKLSSLCVCLCTYSFIPALCSRLSDLIVSDAIGGL